MVQRLSDPRAQAPRSRRGCFVLAALLLVTLVLGCAFIFIILPLMESPKNRKDLIDFGHLIDFGQAQPAVEAHYRNGLVRPHKLGLNKTSDAWFIVTPPEFGARNWVLVISFGVSGVDGIGVRTMGNLKHHPPDAPIDRLAEGAEEAWRSRFGPE